MMIHHIVVLPPLAIVPYDGGSPCVDAWSLLGGTVTRGFLGNVLGQCLRTILLDSFPLGPFRHI